MDDDADEMRMATKVLTLQNSQAMQKGRRSTMNSKNSYRKGIRGMTRLTTSMNMMKSMTTKREGMMR